MSSPVCSDCGKPGPLARTARMETGRDLCTPCLYALSEREIAKRGRMATWPPPDDEARRADYEERAAIMEYDGNIPRKIAEERARTLTQIAKPDRK